MAIGFITTDRIINHKTLGYGRQVEWVFDKEVYLPENAGKDKLRNHRTSTIYEEHSPEIKRALLDIILNPKKYHEMYGLIS